ncbi:hypothetical protein L914_11639 [Phytophthora nicotianae]|uniref:Uncharacterized protein n=2 Tax=Phytophthora nicotianae TaxID=4792 RepID=V9DVH3_PHYNI|nr:hypothetical protein F443_22550 [Phytophthora nicotianae P1569]ETM42768.1 hypothetical protein L914_11639 [Phytophthora nicotianae]
MTRTVPADPLPTSSPFSPTINRSSRQPASEVSRQGSKKENFAASVLKKARLESEKNSYNLAQKIPPTSNVAERLFSVAQAT